MSGGTLTRDGNSAHGSTVEIGASFTGFLERVVRPDACDSVRSSAFDVLEGALQSGPASTGLIVGRVQSGKTLSYEGVIALARDNGFAVVVVISGISNPLLDQGQKRLRADLQAADPGGWNFLSPAAEQQADDYVERELIRVRQNWTKSSTPQAYKQTAVVFLLKNYQRIQSLTEALRRAALGGLRVLVVDDEADQASLNTEVGRGRESTTYSNLLALRSQMPDHYYLQYTATPQAPLLISIQDNLSPDFVKVLEPGIGYTGGQTYFEDIEGLVHTISQSDLQAVVSATSPPPTGLRRAMQEFLIGASHVVASDQSPETRSMLVHPSRETGAQSVFASWIQGMRENWQDKLENAWDVAPANLKAEFEEAWVRIRETFPDLTDFEKCWDALDLVFRNLDVTEVNARRGQTPVIDWDPTKFYILIGGQAIDRGFTVQGLTVTYMPRGGGTFTADTIQQRARFFGYKASYVGLCRVYLDPDVLDAFTMYVNHERDMIKSLREIEAGADSLKDWKRRFLLDQRMRPTRESVIDIPLIRVSTSERWVTDRFPVRADSLPLAYAEDGVSVHLAEVNWVKDSSGLHETGQISLRKALELLEFVTPGSLLTDPNFEALAVQLSRMADVDTDPASVAVYRMRPGNPPSVRREGADGSIQVFTGRTSSGSGYPGDRQIFSVHSKLTIQLHRVEVKDRDTGAQRGQFLVPAWRIPETRNSGWLIEAGS